MAIRMQQRRGTAAQWVSSNAGAGPILNAGEIGWESDTNKFKIGDGTNNWSTLTYFVDATDVIAASLGGYVEDSDIGAISGVAGLNADQNVKTKTGIEFEGATADSFETFVLVTDPTADRTITLPDATGTVALTSDITVTASSTNTLTNKSISLGSNTVTSTLAQLNTAVTDADVASLAGSETLTNKTVALGSNTVSGTLAQFNTAVTDADLASLAGTETLTNKSISLGSNTVTSTLAQLNTAVSDADVASLAGTETLTNKTLTSPVIAGASVTGHIIPATNDTYDLGSASYMWRDIYVGPGSLYVNGQKVLQTVAGDVIITADANENLALKTSGSGNVELDPTGTGVVSIKGALSMEAGSNIASADGNAVTFGGAIAADSMSSKTANTDLSLTANGTGKVYLNDNAEVSGNLVVGGNLTISGTSTTVNTETISLADNIIDLNSNFTTGTPTENAGLRILRGDSANVQVRWNESSDVWDFTNDGTNYSPIAGLASPTFTGTATIPTLTLTNALSISNGGTGATTAMTAATALLPAQTSNSGKYLTTDGSGTLSWGTVSGYSEPTIGSTSIASGATVTTIAGLTLTSPVLTTPSISTIDAVGDLLIGTADNTIGKISIGANGYLLTSNGTTASWQAAAPSGAAFSELMLIGA